jgi:hypothetical protein
MSNYKTLKTTEGRKFRVRMSEDEQAERELYWMVVTCLPFLASVLMGIVFFAR